MQEHPTAIESMTAIGLTAERTTEVVPGVRIGTYRFRFWFRVLGFSFSELGSPPVHLA